ncbi:hypothetical protein SKAU_G00247520 [Synaphobranchus kaupii]|uniref:C-X-C chemokine receptor type 2 n=1 Tax=Synaphobranchus kaupii TaxID=118154 RepID=A0A9Q1F2M1_SYNKA|nr:hypothetical protein SKAU_G00247520 [Synaphobranchus kaupii]
MAAPCVSWTLGSNSAALVCVYSAVFVLSVLGNGLVISVVSCMNGRRTSTDIYLMNLASADLLFSLTLPFWGVYVHTEWVFGTFLCKLVSGLQEATFYSGVLLLSCISIDRYLAIVKATQVIPRKRHLREAYRPGNATRTMCHENLSAKSVTGWRVGIRVLHHTVGFFVPLVVMVYCYGFTAATLFRARNGQKHKAMRVILAVVLAFVACWLPHNVVVLVDTLMRGGLVGETCAFRHQVDLALQVTQVLAFLRCAVNPVLYAFIGQKFRNQLLRSLYARGLIGKKVQAACRRGSANSSTSRRTSVTL